MNGSSVFDLTKCWVVGEYNNHNKTAIEDRNLPRGEVFIVYFLRFLLFCDQCHDFCEDAVRNNWKSVSNEVYNKLKNGFSEDISYLARGLKESAINETNLNKLDIGVTSLESNDSWKKTAKIRDKIDKILLDYFGITASGASAREAQQGCSMAAKRLLQKVNLITQEENSRDQSPAKGYTIAVDADGSRFRLATLLNLVCDEALDPINPQEVKLCDMASTKYDSASGSGAINFITAIKTNYRGTDNIYIYDETQPVSLQINALGIPLMEFSYVLDKKVEDFIDSENWEIRRSKLREDNEYSSEFIYYPASTQAIYNEIRSKGIIVPYIKPGGSSSKDKPWKRDRITKGDIKKLSKKSPEMSLQILGFFNRGYSSFKELNNIITSQNSSVTSLTANYNIINEKWSEGFLPGGMDTKKDDSFSIMCYKTLGDFGQILEYRGITEKIRNMGYNPRSLFITFDTVCSRISALFNKYTIFESAVIEDQGVVVFLPTVVNNMVSSLRDIKLWDKTLDTAVSMTDLSVVKRPRFGKKPKVSIKNTSTRVLKAKLKLVGVPVTKLVNGKRMKLTRRELEQKAGAVKKLQIRCQKRGISLTFVSKKKGRTFKSVKRLLTDMKAKQKIKAKPKMKWG